MEVVEPIEHGALLLLFVQLCLLLFVARGLGVVATRYGLPSVVGELMAGIVIGPSLLGTLAPGVFETVFPMVADQFHLLEVVSWLGLMMLIILTGLETDLTLIYSKAREASYISVASIVVPFAFGFAFAWVLPDRFVAAEGQRLVFSLFVATAMSISAIPVIAKILMDLDAIRRDFGQISLAAGMINDTIGWILLALVAGMAQPGGVEVGELAGTVVWLIVFLGVGFTLGQRVVRRIMRWVDTNIGGEVSKITTLMVLALGVGAFTHYLHLEAVLGAFVVGILVGQVKRFDYETEHTFEVLTIGVFAPIFFATAGLRVDLTALFDPIILAVATGALAIAVLGKFVGSYVGSRAAGLSHWEGITMGSGLNARGAMEIIVAIIGLGAGVLTIEMYSIIVMIAIATSVMAPPMLRWSLQHVEMSDEERERIEREEQQRHSFVANLQRVLLPTRCSVDSQFTARLLGHMAADEDIEVTSMYLSRDESESERTRPLLSRLRRWSRPARKTNEREVKANGSGAAVEGDADRCLDLMRTRLDLNDKQNARTIVREEEVSATRTVLDEAGQGYDLLAIGASERGARADDPLFTTVVDDIIQETPCPVMVVNSGFEETTEPSARIDDPIERILLPTVGTEYNHHAAEVAFAIARDRNVIVEIVHVVNPPQLSDRFVEQPDMSSAVELGEEIVDKEADLGRQMGAEVKTRVLVGEAEPEEEIVALAAKNDDDLVILGSNLRPVSKRAFFGHRVEHIIQNAPCPVAVLSSL